MRRVRSILRPVEVEVLRGVGTSHNPRSAEHRNRLGPEAERRRGAAPCRRGGRRELNPAHRSQAATLDSRLDRDLGIDSIGRAELVGRIERAFGVALPEHTLAEAETPHDLLTAALARHNVAPIPQQRIAQAPTAPAAAPVPVEAGTLCAALDWHAEHHPDRPHIILEEADAAPSTISYGALAEKARRAACGLRELNIAAGDRVAIMLPTSESFVTAFFAALYAGAVPVPIYPPARPGQIEDHLRRQAAILANAGATVLIAPPAMRTAASLLRSLVDSLKVVASIDSLPRGAAPVPRPFGNTRLFPRRGEDPRAVQRRLAGERRPRLYRRGQSVRHRPHQGHHHSHRPPHLPERDRGGSRRDRRAAESRGCGVRQS